MSKRKSRTQTPLDWDALKGALQVRAEELTGFHWHRLGHWHSAKRRHGKGAIQAECPTCRKRVVVMPGGCDLTVKKWQEYPAITGSAVFEACDVEGAFKE